METKFDNGQVIYMHHLKNLSKKKLSKQGLNNIYPLVNGRMQGARMDNSQSNNERV